MAQFIQLNVLLRLPRLSLGEPAVPAQVNWRALASIFPFSASLNWWSPIILTPSFSQAGCGVFSFPPSSFLYFLHPTQSAWIPRAQQSRINAYSLLASLFSCTLRESKVESPQEKVL